MTAAIGYGIVVEVETTAGSGTYTTLAQVFQTTPPDAEVEQVETTHYTSTGRRREYVPGLTESGEVPVSMNYVPGSATDVFLEAWRADATVRAVRITYANSVVVSFSGFAMRYGKATPLDDRMTAELMIKVTGAVTQAAAAAPTNTLLPAISGTPRVGFVLTALVGEWTGAPAYTYQWQVDTAGNGTYANVTGATARTYTPVSADQTDRVRVIVTGTNSAGNASATSIGTAPVAAA